MLHSFEQTVSKLFKILLLLIIFLSINCYSRNNFRKGYYINNSDEKKEWLIKTNSKLNPTEFTYKLSEDSNEQIEPSNLLKNLGFTKHQNTIRKTIDSDRRES